jgi:hypothetical protein
VQWTNPNMNRFDAHIICNNIIKTKEKYDFRPSCHALAYRLTDTVEISDKLLLGFAEFDPQFDFSIENYINLKLNVKL